MKLVSDFRDYYDWAFDGKGNEFDRVAKGAGPSRREQHDILERAGCNVPIRGTVKDLHYRFLDEGRRKKMLVVYDDDYAHCTEGKSLLSIGMLKSNPHMGGKDRFEKIHAMYCTEYIGESYPPSTSFRYLQVGRHQFWIVYTSTESWMSNYGEGDIEVIAVELDKGYRDIGIESPLYAIDFVADRDNDLYAVDLNIAPGIRGTSVEKYLDAIAVVESIESHVKQPKYDLSRNWG